MRSKHPNGDARIRGRGGGGRTGHRVWAMTSPHVHLNEMLRMEQEYTNCNTKTRLRSNCSDTTRREKKRGAFGFTSLALNVYTFLISVSHARNRPAPDSGRILPRLVVQESGG